MPYSGIIPGPNDLISVSQGQIQANFASILAGFDQNHMDFNAGINIAGQHTFVQLNGQTAWPVTGSFPGSVGFWANAAKAVFLHNAAGQDLNISSYNLTAGCYTSILPSGLIIKFGQFASGGPDGPAIVNFNPVFPSQCLAAFATIFDNTGTPANHYYISISNFGAGSMTVQRFNAVAGGPSYGQPRSNAFTWFAIGF